MTNKAKKLDPNKTVCKHEGCFEGAQIKGHCRKHFLSVLNGKSEGDNKPRGKLSSPEEARRKPKRRQQAEVSLDEAFAENQPLKFDSLEYSLDETDSEIFGRSAYKKNLKVA